MNDDPRFKIKKSDGRWWLFLRGNPFWVPVDSYPTEVAALAIARTRFPADTQ